MALFMGVTQRHTHKVNEMYNVPSSTTFLFESNAFGFGFYFYFSRSRGRKDC